MASLHILAAMSGSKQFSNVGMEVLSSVIHLVGPCSPYHHMLCLSGGSHLSLWKLGVSVISFMLSTKIDLSELPSFNIRHVSWPRVLIILNLLDS